MASLSFDTAFLSFGTETIASLLDLARQVQAAPPHGNEAPILRLSRESWNRVGTAQRSVARMLAIYDQCAMDLESYHAFEALKGSTRRWLRLYGRSPAVHVGVSPNTIEVQFTL